MFSLRHLPVFALLSSCSVYNESLLDDVVLPENGGALISAGTSSLPNAQGGRTGGGGNKGTAADASGGDGEATAAGKPASSGSGGTSSANGGTSSGELAGASALGGSAATAGSGTGGSVSPPSGVDLLDDMEDGNFYLSPKPPRYGFWYLAGDTTVGAKLPKIEELVDVVSPARAGSTSAVHFTATGFKGWGSSVGLSFTDSASKRGAYDGGNAVGVSFWVKGSVSNNAKLRVLFPVVGTDPVGKLCGGTDQGQCLDHFATQLSVTAEWQQVQILFASLHQAGWGVPLTAFEPGQMLGIEWSPGAADADVWIDDLALLRP